MLPEPCQRRVKATNRTIVAMAAAIGVVASRRCCSRAARWPAGRPMATAITQSRVSQTSCGPTAAMISPLRPMTTPAVASR